MSRFAREMDGILAELREQRAASERKGWQETLINLAGLGLIFVGGAAVQIAWMELVNGAHRLTAAGARAVLDLFTTAEARLQEQVGDQERLIEDLEERLRRANEELAALNERLAEVRDAVSQVEGESQ